MSRPKSTTVSSNKKSPSKKRQSKKEAAVQDSPNAIYLSNKTLLAELKNCKAKDVMSDKLAKLLLLLCSRYAKRGNFAGYCVDEDTTALTKRGWLSYEELRISDEILSYDTKTNQLKWSKILDIFINRNYNGPMHHLTTRGMDALVTPNHKFVSKERGIIPVEDIICNEHIILTGDGVKDNTTKKYDDSFVQLVGWTVTEGHYKKHSKHKRAICIYQNQGTKADNIRKCLLESAIPYKEYTSNNNLQNFYCTGALITEIYDNIAPNKVISNSFILSLTPEQRMLLIKTLVDGDGWIRPNGGMSYTQKDKNHVDSFLMLCTISGLITGTRQRVCNTPISSINPHGGKTIVYSINIFDTKKRFCKAEKIDFNGGRTSSGGRRYQKENIPTVNYKGTVWCPQTEYGTFVCRRNDYIYVTGNTYNDDMQAYAMMMLVKQWKAFDPKKSNNPFAFFTQCIKNSFIQYLNQEKRQRVVRDKLLLYLGKNPSFNFLSDDEKDHEQTSEIQIEDEEDHEQFESDYNKLNKQIEQMREEDIPPNNEEHPENDNSTNIEQE